MNKKYELWYFKSFSSKIGWGLDDFYGEPTEELHSVELPILTNELCKEYLGSKINITDNHLCAGHDEGKRDGCTMDSGGGLTTIKSGIVESRFTEL